MCSVNGMASPRHWFILVISDRDALGWILSQQRMAFAPSRYHLVEALTVGDRLALYTTRGCFNSPTRDRGRVIGTATVTSPLSTMDSPVTFGGREFNKDCTLHIDRLAAVDQGPELASLVTMLHTFPEAWRIYIRRTLVPLDERDFATLENVLAGTDTNREKTLPTYLKKITKRGARPQSLETQRASCGSRCRPACQAHDRKHTTGQ